MNGVIEMIEKRFTLISDDGLQFYDYIEDNGKVTHTSKVVTILNELYEENKLLRCTIVEILDFVEENDGVSLEEMKKWWRNKEEELCKEMYIGDDE